MVQEGTELVAALSPNGRRIALIILGQVFLVDREGGEALPLTDPVAEPEQIYNIAWSPDSRRLFLSGADRRRLRVLDIETHEEHLLSGRDGPRWAVWTPDGDAILLLIPRGDSTEVRSIRVGAPASERVAALPHARAGYPAIAPDGRSLAFATSLAASGHLNDQPSAKTELREVDLATGAERVLVPAEAQPVAPAYSPDGRWIAYLSAQSGSRELWAMPRQGGKPRMLTRGAEDVYLGSLSWTPDSRAVLYTAAGRMRVASVDGAPEEEIAFSAPFRVLRWSGLRRPDLPEPGERRRARGIVHPEISPDGARVVFAALGDLWTADVEGTAPERLTNTPWVDESRPRWSPEGERIAYVAAAPGTDRTLRVLSLAAPAESRALSYPVTEGASFNGDVKDFAWSPDGARLAFLTGSRLGWIDVETGELKTLAATPFRYTHLLGWTADGDSILFSPYEFKPDTARSLPLTRIVERVSAADSGRTEVLPIPIEYALWAGWTRDLSRAAYSTSGRGYHVRTDGVSAPVRIEDPSPRFFSWSSDGRRLLYLSGTELRLLDVGGGTARTLDVAPSYQVAPAPAPLLVRNVRILDGRGTPPSAPSDLLVEGGRIQRIVPAGQGRALKGARVIDGAGQVLMPGLIDMHMHLLNRQPVSPGFIYHGVLAVRDLGTTGEWMQAQRERAEAGQILSPRIFGSAGMLVQLHGGGADESELGHREVVLEDSAAVAGEIRSLIATGSDVLKVYFKNAVLDAVGSREAHAQGLPVTTHYVTPGALAHGLEGKEHSSLYNRGWTARYRDDVTSLLRAAGTCFTPTLLVHTAWRMNGQSPALPYDSTHLNEPATRRFSPPSWLAFERARLAQPLSESRRSTWERRFASDLESVRAMHEAGVRIATGTDAGPEGLGVHMEMELLTKAGLSPLEAIRAATYTAASCLGVEDELGSIEAGKRADFLLVDGDPSQDIRAAQNIRRIVLGGQLLTREEILKYGPQD